VDVHGVDAEGIEDWPMLTLETRCSQSRSSAREAVPSFSTRPPPESVARSASERCR
jgi:hypothetical protein